MHEITIQRHEIRGGKVYVYYREPGDTGDHCHAFPEETFEWRVAEYDLDPDDVEALLEIVLAERWEQGTENAGRELLEIPAADAAARSSAVVNVREGKEARVRDVGLMVHRDARRDALLVDLPHPSQEGIARKMNVMFDIRNRGKQPGRSRRSKP